MIQKIENRLESKFIQTVVLLIAIVSASVAVSIRIGKIEGRLLLAENQICAIAKISDRVLALETLPRDTIPDWFVGQFAEFKLDIKSRLNEISKDIKDLNVEVVKLKEK